MYILLMHNIKNMVIQNRLNYHPILKKLLLASAILLIIISIKWFNPCHSYAMPAENVVPLINEQYFYKVHKALGDAKKSIFCVMYLAKVYKNHPSGFSDTLISDLIHAHKRGVKIKVILDQNLQFWERNRRRKNIERKSELAYKKLLKAGVPVFYDDRKQITHSKIIVIDEYVTILGSTNWTYYALNKNNEASILIESREVAKEFLSKLNLIPRERVQE